MANQIGKRYTCEECGSEVLCLKTGPGTVQCHGKDMEIKEPKRLASSD